MIYVLAYPEFEPQSARRIDRFRSAYEPERAKLVPPHITLVFGLKNTDPKSVLSLCEKVSENTPELGIEFDSSEVAYDPFDRMHKLFLLCGASKDRLTDLHHQLYNGPHRTQLNSEFPFQPHMTVATNADRSIIEQIDISELGALPLTGTIKALEVVQLAGDTLSTLETLPFRT